MIRRGIALIIMLLGSGCASFGRTDGSTDLLRLKAEQDRMLRERMAASDESQRRPMSALGMARLLVQQGKFDLAAGYVERAVADEPKNPEAAYLEGVVRRQRHELPPAKAAFERAVKLAPKMADAYDALGQVANLAGDHERAVEHYRQALAIRPGHPPYLNDLGFAHYLLGQIDQAVAAYNDALAVAPTVPLYHNNLGFAFGRAGRFADAFREFRLGGNEATAYNNLGFVYQSRGEAREAVKMYAEALRSDPRLGRAYQNLVQTCAQLPAGESACGGVAPPELAEVRP